MCLDVAEDHFDRALKEHRSSFLLQIPMVVDLPVGENLLDHLFVDIPFLVDGKIAITPTEVLSWKSSLEYDFLGKGSILLQIKI